MPTQDRSKVNVERRAKAMMENLSQVRSAQSNKAAKGLYNGQAGQLRDDMKRLSSYVPFILQEALNDRIFYRASTRCSTLYNKIKEADWIIPVDGELMKELGRCENEVSTASAAIVSAMFLICLFPSL